MIRIGHFAGNALLGTGYLVGLAIVWLGLEALVFGGEAARSLYFIALGFGVWVALAAMVFAGADTRSRRQPTDER